MATLFQWPYTFHAACQWPDREWSFLADDLEDQVFPAEMESLQEMIAELKLGLNIGSGGQ